MSPKMRLLVGTLVLGVAFYLVFINLESTIAPYVSIAEAKSSAQTVQVAGFPDHQSAGFDSQLNAFTFTITDEDGESLKIVYAGGKPGNFDQAQSVVVIGNYREGLMEAKQILVKCPSKYEAEEAKGEEHPA